MPLGSNGKTTLFSHSPCTCASTSATLHPPNSSHLSASPHLTLPQGNLFSSSRGIPLVEAGRRQTKTVDRTGKESPPVPVPSSLSSPRDSKTFGGDGSGRRGESCLRGILEKRRKEASRSSSPSLQLLPLLCSLFRGNLLHSRLYIRNRSYLVL